MSGADTHDTHADLVAPEATGGSLPDRFLAALRGVAGIGVMAAGSQEAGAAVLAALRERQITEVVAWADPYLERLGLETAAHQEGISWHTLGPDREPDQVRALCARAGAGVTTADLAMAQTGTLVLTSGPGRPRSVSLLPPLHIAVVPTDRLLPGMPELFRELAGWAQAGGPPASINLVTGPSRTADIEHISVRRVHGPGELIVVLVASDSQDPEQPGS